jgi:hypothetical protein
VRDPKTIQRRRSRDRGSAKRRARLRVTRCRRRSQDRRRLRSMPRSRADDAAVHRRAPARTAPRVRAPARRWPSPVPPSGYTNWPGRVRGRATRRISCHVRDRRLAAASPPITAGNPRTCGVASRHDRLGCVPGKPRDKVKGRGAAASRAAPAEAEETRARASPKYWAATREFHGEPSG